MKLSHCYAQLRTALGVALGVAIGGGAPALAATLEITVRDAEGKPVPCVAVYAVRRGAAAAAPVEPAALAAPATQTASPATASHCAHAAPGAADAVMGQSDNAFVPHMLVVERGTAVRFPNSDSVSHHVYSFSEAKQFELALYKGDQAPPVAFDRAGVVVLGCNIHDGMLGYVVVVDSPHYATTDLAGRAVLYGLAPNGYTVDVFTPRLKPKDAPPARAVTLTGNATPTQIEIRIEGKLAAPHGARSGNLTWHRY